MTFCPIQTVVFVWFHSEMFHLSPGKQHKKQRWRKTIHNNYLTLSNNCTLSSLDHKLLSTTTFPPLSPQPPGASSVLLGRHTTPEWAFTWLSYVTPDNIMAGLLGVLTTSAYTSCWRHSFPGGLRWWAMCLRCNCCWWISPRSVQWSVWLFDHWSVWLFDHATPCLWPAEWTVPLKHVYVYANIPLCLRRAPGWRRHLLCHSSKSWNCF